MRGRRAREEVPPSIGREFHKAVRFALAELLSAAGAATAHPDSIENLTALWSRAASLLRVQQRQEMSYTDPVLARFAPHHRERLERENASIGIAVGLLDRDMIELGLAPPETLWERLEHWYLDLATFFADELHHLQFVEGDVMRSLRDVLIPGQVDRMRTELMNELAPEELVGLLSFMLPAVNRAERVDVMTHLATTAATPLFEECLAVAEDRLTDVDFRDLGLAAGLF